MEAWQPRERRVALYVPVETDPTLDNCWSVNLSRTGISLSATRPTERALPREGAGLALSLQLPGGARIEATGTVRWLYDSPGALDGRSSIGLGVQFTDVDNSTHSHLADYFFGYRPHVALAWASDVQRGMAERILGDEVNLHFIGDDSPLEPLLARGDIAAVVLCGEDADRGLRAAKQIRSAPGSHASATPSGHDDLAPRIIVATATDPRALLRAFNAGWIHTCLAQPIDERELQSAVQRAIRDHDIRVQQHRVAYALERALARERASERGDDDLRAIERDRLVLESESMQHVLEQVRIVAPHRVSVLLTGETGVGKEIIGGLVHRLSDRASAPFVVQDCGALTETLLDSELFGHVKGAFTGAVTSHPGLFVLADGGTIFLDEIQNASPSVQAKLLRAIETGEVRAVGSREVRRVDVRIIAASNRDLEDAVQHGQLRADLYFRLSVFPIHIAPLRERPEDIMPLARLFLAFANGTLGRSATEFDAAATRALLGHAWPGNVRELKNLVDRAVLLVPAGQAIGTAQLPASVLRPPAPSERTHGSLRQQLEDLERSLIEAALERNQGVLRRAAQELEMNPITLGRRARQHRLI